MSLTAEQIRAGAMKLPPEERADFADWPWIISTPREKVKATCDVEIARRIAEIDAGEVELTPGEEVLARIDKELRKAGM